MKKLLLLFILFTTALCTYGQKIKFYDNVVDGLAKAKQTKKPMFVMVGPASLISGVQPANRPKFTPGLDDKEVAEFYSKKFISVEVNVSDSSVVGFRKFYPYKISSYPAYLFFDSEGGLIYKGMSVITSTAKPYLDMANNALAATSGKTITKYEELRKQKKLDKNGYREYISLKQQLGLFDNAALADEYVNYLTIGDFENYNEILFIMKAGPIAYGKAYNLCFTNKKLTDSLYKTEPVQVRVAINNHIKENTRAEAIRTKNVNLAMQLAGFSNRIQSSNYQLGGQWYAYEMLNYYQQVKDTANYYRQATNYYDTYYMRLSPDSIKKRRERSMEASKKASMENIRQLNPNVKFSTGTRPDSTGTLRRVTTNVLSSGPAIEDVPSILNNVAYTFYSMGTRNPANLTKAMLWCKRAMSLSPGVHAYYDTMAHLLYRLDLFEEAILNQTKAIELAQKQQRIDQTYMVRLKTELDKMKQHTL